jgi:hypothetical protein
MKPLLYTLALFLIAVSANAQQYVNGYNRQDGTYVNGYYRSTPNNTTLDNYSSRGNVNPYTGNRGTVAPNYSSPSSYGSGNSYGSGSSYGGTQRRSSYGY